MHTGDGGSTVYVILGPELVVIYMHRKRRTTFSFSLGFPFIMTYQEWPNRTRYTGDGGVYGLLVPELVVIIIV